MKDIDFSDWLEDKPKKHNADDLYHALCRAIIGQQLSGKAAATIYGRFLELFPKKDPAPNKILKLEDQQLRDAGMSWAKVASVKDLAQKVKDKELHLEKLDDMDDLEVIDELINVKGIGEWTAQMFLLSKLQRPDIFSLKDLGLRKGIMKVYDLTDPSDEEITKITDKWRPYRSYGSITLWRSLEI